MDILLFSQSLAGLGIVILFTIGLAKLFWNYMPKSRQNVYTKVFKETFEYISLKIKERNNTYKTEKAIKDKKTLELNKRNTNINLDKAEVIIEPQENYLETLFYNIPIIRQIQTWIIGIGNIGFFAALLYGLNKLIEKIESTPDITNTLYLEQGERHWMAAGYEFLLNIMPVLAILFVFNIIFVALRATKLI